jgi:aminoglycoside/choline kinase family phosphotransferase
MTSRAEIIATFVGQTVWRDWQMTPITGDASNRRYWRLENAGQSMILMDDAPDQGGSTTEFAQIAQLLLHHGLQAPQIFAHDPAQGLMIISDLGATDLAAWLQQTPSDERRLYRTATDVLVKLHHIEPPSTLTTMTPKDGGDILGLVGEFYSRNDVGDLKAAMHNAMAEHAPISNTLALRDFHAENLIWRDAHDGLDRVGLLDFQDAFIAPAGYDLVSLLTDARRDVGRVVADEMTAYFADKIGADKGFATQLACLGIQRNLRILGIFGRLSLLYGKPKYLALVPRVWEYIRTDLADPALSDLRQAVMDTVPTPSQTVLDGLAP